MESTTDQVLFLLKTLGSQRTGDLAEALALTRQGVRQHLERLATRGLVSHSLQKLGVGRPGQRWALTDAGHARFPDTHAHLTVELIEAMTAEFGGEAIERVIARREPAAIAAYVQRCAGSASLRDRVTSLADARSAEGYMAEWRENDDGALMLIENHCPIRAAAGACQGFCSSELRVFQAALGPAVAVERVEHVLTGSRRCAYRITVDDDRPPKA